MKTTFLKSKFSFVLVAVLGILGAFATTSMQKVSAFTPVPGYINGPAGPCSVEVSCSDIPIPQLCQANGQQAFGKENNCMQVRYYLPPN